jgi:cytochrome c oxidase subunit 2
MRTLLRHRLGLLGGVVLVLVLAGCGGNQNTVAPASHPERAITQLFWVMLAASCVGFGLIVFLLFLGWVRRAQPTLPFGGGERAATGVVIGMGVALPVVLLSALFIWSDFFVMKSTAAPAQGSTSMTIHVIGHQWWWEVRYDGSRAVTANEIHIPVKTRVAVVVTTADVIHSFWIPELNRKIDMIPGLSNRLLLIADKPGTYRGQCAEFCGLQHAHMSVEVIAQPRAQFDAWLSRNAQPAAATNRVFNANCSSCHQIRGTSANGTVGPDLTHFGSRRTLAALTLENTPSALDEWLADPQHVKPGNVMPDLHLDAAQRASLVRYLESLK